MLDLLAAPRAGHLSANGAETVTNVTAAVCTKLAVRDRGEAGP